MAGDDDKRGRFGSYFKFEWLLTSIILGGMTVFIAIQGFDTPLWVAVVVGLVVALADIAVLAWLDQNPTLKRKDRK